MLQQIKLRMDGTLIDHDNYPKQFLDIAEEFGMLPPWYRKFYHEGDKEEVDPMECIDYEYVTEWEPETKVEEPEDA